MSSPSAGKRRMDTDVIKLIESKLEVTILGGLNDFAVKFYGPKGKCKSLLFSLLFSKSAVFGHNTLLWFVYSFGLKFHYTNRFRIESKHEVTIVGGLNDFSVKFYGPKGTPYEGGVWKVRVHLPEHYPFKSPSIGFMNRVYHPNIDEVSGTVCLDVINQAWTALYDLSNIFESFLPQLLTYPNPIDPLNGDAAAMYLHKPEEYKKKVSEYVRKYATEEALRGQENNVSSDSESSMSDFSENEAEDMEL